MVRITYIKLDPSRPADNLAITALGWLDEQSQKSGETTRVNMYDWIVNKKGKAFVRGSDGSMIFLFGAVSPAGEPYVRTIKEQAWSDDLLGVPHR